LLCFSRVVGDAVFRRERIVPVFMFTLHAYRSWMPDHRRGYVVRGKGIHKTDAERARRYHDMAKHERMVFHDERCEQIIAAAREVCGDKQWRLHAVVAVWTHVHVLVSWHDFYDAKRARAVIKRGLSTRLRDWSGERHKWFAGAGSVKHVRDRKHFQYLMREYLPRHRKYGGRQWYEGA
jgi:REP element-mobilizing transposase RayT